MALNVEQTRLIRSTVPLIRQDGERIATLFYNNMIRDHPGMMAYFNPTSMQRGHQPRAFTMMMLAFASNINDISELVARMEKVAQKHASLAITPDLYDIVGDYLLRAFGTVLGEHCWTSATREAWEKAYAVMAGMLTRREALIYKDFGNWVGWRKFVVTQRWTELAEGNDGDGDVVTIEVKPQDGKKLPGFKAGQYISLRVAEVPDREHPQIRQYYLSGNPTETGKYRFTVRRDASRETESFHEVEQRRARPEPAEKAAPQLKEQPSSRTLSSSLFPFTTKLTASLTTKKSSSRRRYGTPPSSTGSANSSRPNSPSTAGSSITSNSGMRVKPGVVSSMLIDQINQGDVLELTHPAGEFTLGSADSDNSSASSTSPVVLISAGVGAAPCLSMLKALLPAPQPPNGLQQHPPSSSVTQSTTSLHQRSRSQTPLFSSPASPPPQDQQQQQQRPQRPVSYIHASRHRPLYSDRIAALAKENPVQLKTAYFKTRLADAEALSYTTDFATDLNLGRIRPVEDLFLTAGSRGSGMEAAEYYVCGPHKFMVEVKKYLETNGIDVARKVKFGMLSIGAMDKKD